MSEIAALLDLLMATHSGPAERRDWKGICHGCGECCGSYPLPVELFARFEERIQVPMGGMPIDDQYVMPLTVDNLCPFLSRHDRICTIYADRPPICRLYGEIPELPCAKLHPEAARLAFDGMVERIAKRLGFELQVTP